MRALVLGFFSTVGDIEVLRQVERQLSDASIAYDVSPHQPKAMRNVDGWVDVRQVDPTVYSHLLVVCGPFYREYFLRMGIDLDRFAHCTRIGVNLTMIETLDAYNPFDALLGRDSDQWHRHDLSFLETMASVRVAGLCLVSRQSEYGARQMHEKASALLRRLAQRADLATIEMDTEWPVSRNASGFSSPAQFESITARLDVMLTTRLHGMVLALKSGVPVIAVDAIAGGGKVGRQGRAVGWPEVFGVESVTDDALDAALARCLAPSARDSARKCAASAREALAGFPTDFQTALQAPPQGKLSFTTAIRKTRLQRVLDGGCRRASKLWRWARG